MSWFYHHGHKCLWLLILAMMIWVACRATQIKQHPGGNAEYLQGDACTILATQDVNLKEFHDLMVWCSTHHMEYLSDVSQEPLP